MSIRSLDAGSAYAQALGRAVQSGGASETGSAAAPFEGRGSFGALLSSMVQDTVAANHQAEIASAKSVTGNSDIVSIASAVNNAEMTLETLVAVRDRMISAYQDIMRMPI
jgi:flagellar hook-basal body complex protein FliE